MTVVKNKRNTNLRNVTLKMPKEMHSVLKLMATQENTTVENITLYIVDNILRGVLSRAAEQAQAEDQTKEDTKGESS